MLVTVKDAISLLMLTYLLVAAEWDDFTAIKFLRYVFVRNIVIRKFDQNL